MSRLLRTVGWIVLFGGIGAASIAAGLFAGDERFAEVAAGYARHPDHPLFQIEYATAAARHYGLLLASLVSFVGGITAGLVLVGVGHLLHRLPGRE